MRNKLAEQMQTMVIRENAYQAMEDEARMAIASRDRGLQTIQLLMSKTKDMADEIERYKLKEVKKLCAFSLDENEA